MINQARALFPNLPSKVLHTLLMHIVNVEDISRIVATNRNLTDAEQTQLTQHVHKFNTGMPLEYITGKCGFYGMQFIVNESVLIPRIETELLVEKATEYIVTNFQNKKCRIADICTGSGIISVAVATHCLKKNIDVEILAVDISNTALGICTQNITLHNVQHVVKTLQMDILADFPRQTFNIILSNPPYIETDTIATLADGVKNFEPHLALNGGNDGLQFYRRLYDILQQSQESQTLFAEIGYNQGKSISQIFAEFNPIILQDFNTNDRLVVVKK